MDYYLKDKFNWWIKKMNKLKLLKMNKLIWYDELKWWINWCDELKLM